MEMEEVRKFKYLGATLCWHEKRDRGERALRGRQVLDTLRSVMNVYHNDSYNKRYIHTGEARLIHKRALAEM